MLFKNRPIPGLALVLFSLFAPSSHAATALSDPRLKGQLVLKSMPPSRILHGRKITTWIYLPPGYDQKSQSYPVIYLLHGQPGGWTDCYRSGHVDEMADALITAGEMPPAILVAFDADGPCGADDLTNFCNRVPDDYRVEDFIAGELVPYIDATYRTVAKPEMRALWGYSAGGYGALNLGLKHPDTWRVLCSHAGFYAPENDEKNMVRILGKHGPLWDQNNPLLTAKKLASPGSLHVYLDASPKEEDYDDFVTLKNTLQSQGVDCQAQTFAKAHAWKLIVARSRDSLLFAARAFQGQKAAVESSGR